MFFFKYCSFCLKIFLTLTNSVDLDKIPLHAAFHLGLQCKHMFWGRFEYHQNVLVKKLENYFLIDLERWFI